MRTFILVLGLMAGVAQAADGRVQVSFVNSDKFADFGDSRWDRERNEKELGALLQQVAGDLLPTGQTLSLRITDVNLAGEVEWWRFRGQPVRVMRDITWPVMEFDYQLRAGGQVLKSGSARLADMGYLQDNFFRARLQGEAYKYEQRMLERWVQRELPRP